MIQFIIRECILLERRTMATTRVFADDFDATQLCCSPGSLCNYNRNAFATTILIGQIPVRLFYYPRLEISVPARFLHGPGRSLSSLNHSPFYRFKKAPTDLDLQNRKTCDPARSANILASWHRSGGLALVSNKSALCPKLEKQKLDRAPPCSDLIVSEIYDANRPLSLTFLTRSRCLKLDLENLHRVGIVWAAPTSNLISKPSKSISLQSGPLET